MLKRSKMIQLQIYVENNVPSKLRACVHDFSTSAHSIFLLAYNKHRSRMLLLTRQANARTAK